MPPLFDLVLRNPGFDGAGRPADARLSSRFTNMPTRPMLLSEALLFVLFTPWLHTDVRGGGTCREELPSLALVWTPCVCECSELLMRTKVE
mmetsp:Transcript_76527/g.224626  ORF Transcript_76527/g.224626 Transcript_76527/m.224626 type:complete len:91 (+) Transcript_76527:1211-1483(+)